LLAASVCIVLIITYNARFSKRRRGDDGAKRDVVGVTPVLILPHPFTLRQGHLANWRLGTWHLALCEPLLPFARANGGVPLWDPCGRAALPRNRSAELTSPQCESEFSD